MTNMERQCRKISMHSANSGGYMLENQLSWSRFIVFFHSNSGIISYNGPQSPQFLPLASFPIHHSQIIPLFEAI
jgi:hypothetical protein